MGASLMAMNTLSRWMEPLSRLPAGWRSVILALAHLVFFSAAYVGAFLFRFDLRIPAEYLPALGGGLLVLLAIKTAVFAYLKMFQGWWKYVSLYDIISLAYALAISALLFMAVNTLVLRPEIFPRSIYLLDFTLSLVLLGGVRGALRLVREAMALSATPRRARNLMIVGAGDAGDLMVREINRSPSLRLRPLLFVDDDPYKRGLRLHGIPVEGPIDRIAQLVARHDIEEIIIALPPEEQHQVRRVIELAGPLGVHARILPAVEAMLHQEISLDRLREVSIADLLRRDPVELDLESLAGFLKDRRVLVTGAGGSIGSELCRQIAGFSPSTLMLVEQAETPLFEIHRELNPQNDRPIVPCIASVADAARMRAIFEEHRPQVVLHAAAYKHVPLMEQSPAEAVKNNVRGTEIVARLSAEMGVATFVLISTDKAVNPTSVMGATKRVTEWIVARQGQEHPGTRFCAVRFGNVLGSNGSVVPIFRDQIRRGGPVTVTHPEMTRYFMTIPEAVQLVLQAASFESQASLFILDMGRPVRIADLARDMIRLSGANEAMIPIVFTGIRPGEKLFEELTLDEEEVDRTEHAQIFVGKKSSDPPEHFDALYCELLAAADRGDHPAVRVLLGELIPDYQSPHTDATVLELPRLRAAR
ncbi:polysaccharide biosynthesis protein [Lujinxingia vulgaris]|uniref:Polysaccharide biosynthesis protein n=2 Tax=Lujinxingia vulgaris TaxID=2600176 RepID=A0A5C6XEX1_9DELT|nr:polysaccharide biosynthesis protein [Lujinxingia vulgaris]